MSQYKPELIPASVVYSHKEATLDVPLSVHRAADELARQAQRLAVLDEYGLLDTAPDAGLEALVRLAAQVCHTPIALITVAGQPHRIKAGVGWDPAGSVEAPVFCLQVAQQDGLLLVPDVTAPLTTRLRNTEPHVRFCAGLPLISPDDHSLGTLCVLDTHPRTLSAAEQEALATVAQAILEQWKLRRALTQSLRAEQALRLHEQQSTAVIEGALDCIILIDHHGRVREWNPAAERVFGYRRDSVLGQLLTDLIIPHRLREQHQHGVLNYAFTGKGPAINRRVEVNAVRADGREIAIEVAVTPIETVPGQPLLFAAYLRDISEQRRNKAALEQARNDLEMRVHERTIELARTNAALRVEIHQRTQIEAKANLLNVNLTQANQELTRAYDTTIEGWARALDLRDKETEGHSRRVTEMSVRLAQALGLPDKEILFLRWGALLHDIGKMGIPDHILHKPGPLDADEWVIMRRHPEYALDMLRPITFLEPSLTVPYCHHEKWDGSGYPQGLKGEEIPLAARIFSIVDVWDALRADRPYRPAWTDSQVREHIAALSGTHFDPTIVPVFLTLLPST